MSFQSLSDLGSLAEFHSLRSSSGPVLFSTIHRDSEPLCEPPEHSQNRTCWSKVTFWIFQVNNRNFTSLWIFVDLKVNQLSVLLIKEGMLLKLHWDQSANAICSVLIIFRLIELNQDRNLDYLAIYCALACFTTNQFYFSVSRRDVDLLKIKQRKLWSDN